MAVNFLYLSLGLLLLWFPRQWLRAGAVISARRRRHSTAPWQREPGDPRLSYDEFGKFRNYVDLLRAAAGSVAIMGGMGLLGAFEIIDRANGGLPKRVLVIKVAILFVGLMIQVLRRERRHLSFYAPIFYLGGLMVGVCGPWAALFAFALVWAVNPMFGNAEGFLTILGLVVTGFAVLFHDTSRLLAVAAMVLCLTPVLLALLTRRPLVVFTRKAASSVA
jgi:hypothetical protein